jgi:hypothetical protein
MMVGRDVGCRPAEPSVPPLMRKMLPGPAPPAGRARCSGKKPRRAQNQYDVAPLVVAQRVGVGRGAAHLAVHVQVPPVVTRMVGPHWHTQGRCQAPPWLPAQEFSAQHLQLAGQLQVRLRAAGGVKVRWWWPRVTFAPAASSQAAFSVMRIGAVSVVNGGAFPYPWRRRVPLVVMSQLLPGVDCLMRPHPGEVAARPVPLFTVKFG